MSHDSVAKALSHKMPTPAILQPMEKWAETENNLYKKIISGKLSKAEKQKALKAWADANSAFRDAEFNTTKQTIPLANSQEFNKRSMRLEEKISRHFDEIEELYPDAVL